MNLTQKNKNALMHISDFSLILYQHYIELVKKVEADVSDNTIALFMDKPIEIITETRQGLVNTNWLTFERLKNKEQLTIIMCIGSKFCFTYPTTETKEYIKE